MRELFEKAASLKPRLIFFDEFELLQFKLLIQFLFKIKIFIFNYKNKKKIKFNF